MSDAVNQLKIAAAVAKSQRAELDRRANRAKEAFAPTALKDRAQQKAGHALHRGTAATQRQLHTYRWPIAAVAAGGLAYAFRRPIAHAATVVWDKTEPLVHDIERQLVGTFTAAWAAHAANGSGSDAAMDDQSLDDGTVGVMFTEPAAVPLDAGAGQPAWTEGTKQEQDGNRAGRQQQGY